MTHLLAKRLVSITTASLAALLFAVSANAAPKNLPLLDSRAVAAPTDLPATGKAESGVTGTLNPGAMNAPALTLTLADGTQIQAGLQRTASDNKGTQSWIGSFTDEPGSVLILTKTRGVVTGFANYKDQVLEIQPTKGGKHVLFAVDSSKLPAKFEGLVRPQTKAGDSLSTTSTTSSTTTAAAGDAVVQDILVLYTAASAAKYGQATIESQIQSAVQAANQAYLNSQVNITLNIAAMQQTAIVEQSTMAATLNVLTSDSATAQLRDKVAADVVMLVDENTDYCGYSWIMTSNSTNFAPNAFGVVYSSCLSNQSLAHEVGHSQGLQHDRADANTTGAYPYAYGYRVCVSDGTGWRDIMSYPCTGANRVLLYSNPNLTYNGYPAGISYLSDPANSADNASALANTAATVAAFRSSTSTTTVPAAPSALGVQKATYNSVTVGWTDNSSNESGFKLERSSDGVNFTEIATVGSNIVSYVDSTVASKTTYYYRARAYNSAGVSAYSGTANVTTPDVPPPPPPAPLSVSPTDNKDGTATVSWTVGTTNAAYFEVLRETYSATKGTWGSAMTAATVQANVFSIVDTTGAGTFRYSVRATNAGGASAYVGPVQVIVTSASTTTTTAKRGKKR